MVHQFRTFRLSSSVQYSVAAGVMLLYYPPLVMIMFMRYDVMRWTSYWRIHSDDINSSLAVAPPHSGRGFSRPAPYLPSPSPPPENQLGCSSRRRQDFTHAKNAEHTNAKTFEKDSWFGYRENSPPELKWTPLLQ